MDALYFLAMLIGIAWLAVWSILPLSRRARMWSPFDMRTESENATLDLAIVKWDRGTTRSAAVTPGPRPRTSVGDAATRRAALGRWQARQSGWRN